MELTLYVGLIILSVVFAFQRRPLKSTTLFSVVYAISFAVMSATVRLEFDTDINTYAKSLSSNSFAFYYLREPIVWLGQRQIYSILESAYWTFFVFDLIVGFVLYKALSRHNVPQYVYFSILVFFPFVLGFQNVYRQWVASIFFLYALSLLRDAKRSGWVWLLCSVFSHNVAGVFGVLLLAHKKNLLGKIVFSLAVFGTPALIYVGGGTKSSASSGQNLVIIYIALLFCIILFFGASDKLRVKFANINDYKIVLLLVYIAAFSALFLSPSSAERVAMFALFIVYPFLALKIEEQYKQKVRLRIMLSVGGFFPLMIFGVRSFII